VWGLDALPGDEAREGSPVNPEQAPDTDGVEPAVVDQAPDRLGMHAELVRDLAHAVQASAVDLVHTLNLTHVSGPQTRRTAHWGYRLVVSRALPFFAVVLLAAGCGSSPAKVVETPATPKTTFAGGELTPPRPAPPLSLRDASGHRFTLSARGGRYVLVTFLYTHCPDVCPLIASNLNTVLRALGPKANVEVLAVSVDPKGDTVAAVRAYEKRMHLEPRFHFLIGSRAALHPVWAAWHVLAVDRKPDLVDHVSYTALVDPTGKQRLLYDSQVNAQQVLHDLRLLKKQRA
jgi:protein SCO1/2